MNAYIDVWKCYAQFSGRASRKSFWTFFLINLLVSIIFFALEINFQMSWTVDAVFSLMIFLPTLSVTVRRLHDTNRSAWWFLVVLVPVFGMVILLILLALPSNTQTDFSDHSHTRLNTEAG